MNMEKYDVVIIGGGLGSLTTATYLSKRLRNIAVFEEGKKKKLQKYSKRIRDEEYRMFEFRFFNHDLGGIHPGNLFYEYIKRCGLTESFEYFDNEYAMVVNKNKRILKRPNTFNEFLVYLVRHYPKQRDQIHRLFEDIKRHYEDYKEQKLARLKNKDYTLSSLMIEWGDLSLNDVLDKYFNNQELRNEFVLVYDSVGLNLEDINAYNYFIKFIDTFIEGSHFVTSSYEDIVQTLTEEISKNKEKIFTERGIKEVIFTDGSIEKMIDENGVEIIAKHYVINMRIDEFIDRYAPDKQDIKEYFYKVYPKTKDAQTFNKLYIGLDINAEECGIKESQYIFSKFEEQGIQLMSLVSYKHIDKNACKDGLGAILVEFIEDDSTNEEMEKKVLNQLIQYFPKLNNHITVSRMGKSMPYFGGVMSKDFWSRKDINDLFDVDNHEIINPFKNAYFIGSWSKPEAGITGMIQLGVEYGDIIDDAIYHGDDEEYFITHDELMAIISHQFIPNSLGKQEKNIQFYIGKDSYYVRTKGKHQRLFKGVSEIPDLIIIATNECLYDLSVGNMTLKKALDAGGLEYVGSKEALDEVIDAFDMGIEVSKPMRYKFVQGRKGLQLMLGMLGVILLANLLANYHPYVIISPVTMTLLGVLIYLKNKWLQKILIFDIFAVSLYAVLLIVSLFVPQVNELKDSTYTMVLFSLYWLISWLINKPVAYGYFAHDYRTDYIRTRLFLSMTGGLTFIWGMIFLIIAFLGIILEQTYSSLSYYLVFVGFYLTYYYPKSYVKGTIDK